MIKPVISLFIDNFDSYSYNIIYFLQKINGIKPIVIYPDEINYDEFLEKYNNKIDNIIISPGYGNPEENKYNNLIINILKNNLNIPILGICYGHQLICNFYGGKIKKVKNMFHGNINIIHINKDENGKYCNLFNNIKNDFKATCYNSLKVSKHINTSILDIICYSIYLNEYILMGIKHKQLPYYSVQYHPESVVSEYSYQFFENFKNITIDYHKKNKTIRFRQLENDLFQTYIKNKQISDINNVKDISFNNCLNNASEKMYELKIVKVIGIENLCNISYDIFQNVFYNKDDICFWLDSNNEILYEQNQGEKNQGEKNQGEKNQGEKNQGEKNQGEKNQGEKKQGEKNGIFNDIVNSSRFSYMGNARGTLSDVVEYYFVTPGNDGEKGGKNEYGAIINLKRKDRNKTTSHFSHQTQNNISEKNNCLNFDEENNTYEYQEIIKPNNCLVKYLNKKLEKYKNNFNINLSTFDINENIKNNDSNYSYSPFDKDDFIFNNKDTCLLGYIGLFNYEYKYETIKFLYGKNFEHAKNKDNEYLPVSFFIFPQNFIALDLVTNCLYLICLEPTKEEKEENGEKDEKDEKDEKGETTKARPSDCSHEMENERIPKFANKINKPCDKICASIKKENEQWVQETLNKIVSIVNKRSDQIGEKNGNFGDEKNGNFGDEKNGNFGDEKNKIVFSSSLSKDKYIENVKKCKDKITNGYSYELCLTTSFKGKYYISDKNSIDMLDLYKYLRKINKVSYSCFINYNRKLIINKNKYENGKNKYFSEKLEFNILCLSPEEFLRKNKNNIIRSKPIKGTIKRGKTYEEDLKLIKELKNNKKEISENLMIVDLTTNDFHRLCKMDTVKVTKLFDIESYTFLHQMVSEIIGESNNSKDFSDAIINIFPGGSMTGSPKLISMAILQEIEELPRGIYSGSVGFISIEGNFIFNIIIRTAIIQNNIISIGAGGAITVKSDENAEYDEMVLKFKSISTPICSYFKERYNANVQYII
ncbi:para-aminobenzoic acid synthetase, putative [Plasmodium yoelii]|uniref:aminodeoxychorismate synthase n=1 Tax=Plasmodium yoelii TaxID=5861 RepID=A0A077Y3W2_PLAYE|nr:para-aminobenzoic acid synthetase, putative [Plasmodium yoelii]